MTEFKTSSYCSHGDCVEVGLTAHGAVRVRDSKDRSSELVFTTDDWSAFVEAAKGGEHDYT